MPHFLKNGSDQNKKLFCKQRNKCVSLLRKVKKGYFTSFNEKHLTVSKYFWKTVKTILSNNVPSSEKIKLAEEDDILKARGIGSCNETKRFLLKCCN